MTGSPVAKTRFQDLAPDDRRYALRVVREQGSYKARLLEKDIWVVAVLGVLFEAPFANDLIFKGGTSLSKVWRAIRRFSEDVDITYDIRAFAPDLVSGAGDEALPPNRSQEKRWTQAIRARLNGWVRDQACPAVAQGLAAAGFSAEVRPEAEKLYVAYESLFDGHSFVRPQVMVEFGARSTGEPHRQQPVACDAAEFLPHLVFPRARPRAMVAERTFWEKATAMHVFCKQQRRRGERLSLSRHWHDLARLDEAGIATKALADHQLARSVARHKSCFFREKDASGQWIDYGAAVAGDLQLVPSNASYALLEADYEQMLASGMVLDEGEPFPVLMERCALIQTRANGGGCSAGA